MVLSPATENIAYDKSSKMTACQLEICNLRAIQRWISIAHANAAYIKQLKHEVSLSRLTRPPQLYALKGALSGPPAPMELRSMQGNSLFVAICKWTGRGYPAAAGRQGRDDAAA